MELQATLQKSYYGKAKIRMENNILILTSYNTDVLSYDTINGNINRLWNGYSSTTMKHINDFLLLIGGTPINKKTWLSWACDNVEPVYNIYMSNGFYTHKCTALLTESEAELELEKLQNTHSHCCVWYE